MSKQHTPTLPIRFEKEGQYIVDNSGYKLLYMNPIIDHEKDAKFIVKACNNHDRLVEALNKIIKTAPLGLGGWDALLEAKELLIELKV